MKLHFAAAKERQLASDGGARLWSGSLRRWARKIEARHQVPLRRGLQRAAPNRSMDVVALGVAAMLKQCLVLLRNEPLQLSADRRGRTQIVVCGAIEYVVDRRRHRIFTRPRNIDSRFVGAPDDDDALLPAQVHRLELLSPLCKPFWLTYIALRPDGICGASHFDYSYQPPLWPAHPDALQVLDEICRRVHRELRRSAEFTRLQSRLALSLLEAVGADDMDLALRSRTNTRAGSLGARQVCLVWKYRTAFERMDAENPRLLPVLSAWLYHADAARTRGLDDAIPAMRADLLAAGLPPRAWRYLLQHGARRLQRGPQQQLWWGELVKWLRVLHRARWPEPPPPGFLGMLSDTAGAPDSYDESRNGMPGWFWNWACEEAHARAHDAAAYARLRDDVVRWAWLIRRTRPHPDANQQRRRLQWLRRWARQQETLVEVSDQVSWAQTLCAVPWQDITRLRVVPLLSPRAVREEGIAMHNCADRYLGDCLREVYLLFSLRDPVSGKRVALLGLAREEPTAAWWLDALAGPCNRDVAGWVWKVADAVVAMVRALPGRTLRVLQ